jgi:hypothetical protein
MDSNRYSRAQQQQIIRRTIDMARVWVRGWGIDHVNVHSPGSGQKPFYIGVDGNDRVRRKEFLEIVDQNTMAGEIVQALDIGRDNKASIVFYNELAGITAFYPYSVSARGGLKQRYDEFYSNTAVFDPENQEELHVDKNRFQFNELMPKTDEEIMRYKEAIRAFVLARILGLLSVEEAGAGAENFNQIYCFKYQDELYLEYHEITLGDELEAINFLYRYIKPDDYLRVHILDIIDKIINILISKKILPNFLLMIEFYQRLIYPPQSLKSWESSDLIITRYAPQYAALETERKRIYEEILIDIQNKQEMANALNSLRGKEDYRGMTYSDYAEVLKPFAKNCGKFEVLEVTAPGNRRRVYYDAFALDIENLLPLDDINRIKLPIQQETREEEKEVHIHEEPDRELPPTVNLEELESEARTLIGSQDYNPAREKLVEIIKWAPERLQMIQNEFGFLYNFDNPVTEDRKQWNENREMINHRNKLWFILSENNTFTLKERENKKITQPQQEVEKVLETTKEEVLAESPVDKKGDRQRNLTLLTLPISLTRLQNR